MSRSPSRAFDTCVYRTALWLCPGAFRREYADDMVRDFTEAHDEASTGRAGGLWSLRLVMAVDVARTVLVQWARTGLPLIAVISLTLALLLAGGVATLARRAAFDIPPETLHAETIGALVLATLAVFVIAMTIVTTIWATRLTRRVGRRRG